MLIDRRYNIIVDYTLVMHGQSHNNNQLLLTWLGVTGPKTRINWDLTKMNMMILKLYVGQNSPKT